MLKMVDGTGIIGVDMVCPLGVSTPQPPNYDRVELEGTGMLVLPNSLDAPLERLELGGKTEQVQTSGKNLFDFSNLESGRINISTGALEEHNHTRRLADYIDITDITSFSFYLPGYNKANGAVYVSIYYYDKDKNYLSYKPCGDKIEKYENITPVENAVYIKVSLEQNTIDNPQNIFKVQLEKGAKSTAYEPYTGGKPSPSPEYPQEIKSVGRLNEDTGKYEVEISISGRNLFDFSTCEEGKIFEGSGNIVSAANGLLTDFIPCFPNSQYSRSRTGSTVVAFYDCDKNKIGFEIVGNTTFVTPEKCRYFRFSAVKTLVDYTKIVACPGRTVMDYEPYREPKFFTLTSDRPITKWDRLVEQGGEIGWLYGSYVGRLPKTGYSAAYKSDGQTFYFRQVLKTPAVASREQYFNIFKCGDKNNSKGVDVAFIIIGRNMIEIALTDISIDSSAKFEEYLHGLPDMEVVYQTQEYEFAPLQQSEQNAIRALKTYYPTTVITVDGWGLDPDIKVTYRKEI